MVMWLDKLMVWYKMVTAGRLGIMGVDRTIPETLY